MNKIEKLAERIKSGNYPKEKIDLQQFFHRTVTGEAIPVRERRYQVRDNDRDIDRINRAVNKIQKDGDKSGLEPLTIVSFDNDPEKILNGNHTSEIMILLGEDKAETYRVDFDKDLDGKESNCLMLGNLLNVIPVEKVDVHENDIKRELYQIMDERAQQGLDPIPPDEIKQEIADRYPQITTKTIGAWVGHHQEFGGRRKPLITYTKGELAHSMNALASLDRYKDYAICSPRTLKAWFDTGVGAAFDEAEQQDKDKALIVLYCNTTAMVNTWEEGTVLKNMKEKFDRYKKKYNLTIEVEMLRYD